MGVIAPITGAIGGAVKGFASGGFGGALKGAATGAWNGLTGGSGGGGGIQNIASGAAQIGNLVQGYQDQKNQSANLNDQRQNFDFLRGMIQQQIGGNTAGQGEQGLAALLKQLGGGGVPGATGGFAGPYNPQQIDDSIFARGNLGTNASQDALMQMLSKDSSGQALGAAQTNLEQIANGGGMNVNDLLNAQTASQDQALQQQLSGIRGSVNGLGQLAGTASQFAQQRARNQSMLDNNLLNAQTRFNATQAQTQNRLGAAGQLGNLLLGQGQNTLQAANQLGQLGNASLAQQLQAMQSNQQAGLQANAQNTQSAQSGIAQQIAGWQGLAGIEQGRTGINSQLIGMMMGQQQPLRQGGSPLVNALTEAPVLNTVMDQLARRRSLSPSGGSISPTLLPTGGFSGGSGIPSSLFGGLRL